MNVSIILAHPSFGSFNHAIATVAADGARRLGHAVIVHDLYAERFDPVMPAAELARDAVLPLEVEQQCREIEATDAIIIVHPNWWSSPPAVLRGWVDRVLRAGRAYTFVPDGQGGAQPAGLLRARIGLVFNTSNTPQEKEEAWLGDPLRTHWLKCVFGICGLAKVHRRNFTPVITSTPQQRRQWLEQVQADVGEHLGFDNRGQS